jgi:hypothetical protein
VTFSAYVFGERYGNRTDLVREYSITGTGSEGENRGQVRENHQGIIAFCCFIADFSPSDFLKYHEILLSEFLDTEFYRGRALAMRAMDF